VVTFDEQRTESERERRLRAPTKQNTKVTNHAAASDTRVFLFRDSIFRLLPPRHTPSQQANEPSVYRSLSISISTRLTRTRSTPVVSWHSRKTRFTKSSSACGCCCLREQESSVPTLTLTLALAGVPWRGAGWNHSGTCHPRWPVSHSSLSNGSNSQPPRPRNRATSSSGPRTSSRPASTASNGTCRTSRRQSISSHTSC